MLKCYDTMNQDSAQKAPNVLKRATLIMILTAWETYIEDIALELFEQKFGILKGSHACKYIEKNFQNELKRFHNPDSLKTKRLFEDYFGIDVTEHWTLQNYIPEQARAQLNKWIKKRGDAVHRMSININAPDIVKRDERDKCLRFFSELVTSTEKALMAS